MSAVGLLGKKVGMSRIFDENGIVIPVTLVQAGPCAVLQAKSAKTDGYNAVQLGFDPGKKKRANKPLAGHLKKAGAAEAPPKFVREFRLDGEPDLALGATVDVEMFEVGEKVDVTGTSKGRGFQGAIKRWGSSRGPETHGSRYHRRTGSIGQSAWPSHAWQRKKMPGQMGAVRVTAQNLEVVQVDKEKNLLILKGATPGHANGYLMIRKAARVRKKKQG